MSRRCFIGLISVLFASTGALAEPSQLVRKLMNSEISRFEFGIYRLETALNQYLRHRESIFGSVTYDWASNTLAIKMIRVPRCKTNEDCVEAGRELIQGFVDVYCSTSEKSRAQCDERDDLAVYFAPMGFDVPNFHNGKSAADAAADIRHMVELQASLFSSTERRWIDCSRKYTSRDTFCSPRKR